MNNEEMTPLDRFILLQAIYSKAAEAVSTKERGNLRNYIDSGYRAEYERTGAKTFTLKMFGEKVGMYSISENKGTPPTERTAFDVDDEGGFLEWLDSKDGRVACQWYASEMRKEFVEWYVKRCGEIPGGVKPRKVRTKGTVGGTYKGASLRGFDADKAMGIAVERGLLPTRTVGLLEGGVE